MEVDGVVAHGAGETHAPLSTLVTVSRVQQGAHGHNFVVDVTWTQITQSLVGCSDTLT